MPPLRSPHLTGLVALLVGLGGCAHRDIEPDPSPDLDHARDTNETATGSAHSVGLGKLFILPLKLKADFLSPKNAFERFRDDHGDLAFRGGYRPKNCISVIPLPGENTKPADEEHHVRITFDNCYSLYGPSQLRGTVDAFYVRREGSRLRLRVRSGDGQGGTTALEANGHPASYQADMLVSADDQRRELLWHGQWGGTSQDGRQVSHEASLSIVFSIDPDGNGEGEVERCAEISGATAGSVDQRSIRTVIDSFRTCTGGCPSGSIIGTLKPSGRTLGLVFDGTPTATALTPRGQTLQFPLQCPRDE